MAKERDVIVGLDIGTAKICCLIAQMGENGVDVLGIGSSDSHGLRKGVVVNIEATVESIKRAVEEAETMAGMEIESVYVGVAGGHIKGINSHGVIAVKGGEVTAVDVERVIDAAKAVNIPMDREVIHVIPQEFVVDDQDGILKPIGMNGVRLEAKVHIITGAVTSAQNIVRSVNRAGLEVNDIVVEQLAAADATLDEDEKELGVALIDMGGGTCDIALFKNNAIKGTSVVSLGGANLTNDIAIGLRTPNHEAEKIKKQYGCAASSLVGANEEIKVPGVGGREARLLSRRVLTDIIEPRVVEIFMLAKQEIELSGYQNQLASGVVLTGGAAQLDGIAAVAEEVFELPVRLGTPKGVVGLADLVNSPQYATVVGLVHHGVANARAGKHPSLKGRNLFDKVATSMKGWIRDFF
jgi:cell division protein FtsA